MKVQSRVRCNLYEEHAQTIYVLLDERNDKSQLKPVVCRAAHAKARLLRRGSVVIAGQAGDFYVLTSCRVKRIISPFPHVLSVFNTSQF